MTQFSRPQDANRFLEQMDQELAGWTDPATRLRRALEQNELELYLQPIVGLVEMQYVMAEVLVRLREEEAMMLPPGEFLPVFEEFGMMPDLDRWVIGRVAHGLARNALGGFRHLSINVSGQTLADEEMPPFVARTLEDFRVPGEALCFEIDESDVQSRLDPAAVFAARVRRLGCKVAIDGFGRRAASFAPLKRLHADYIKVDGSITRNLLRSETAVRKMQTIVRVGDAIGVGVIAEFVEETEILARLRALGVRYAQGFGIARPAPVGGA